MPYIFFLASAIHAFVSLNAGNIGGKQWLPKLLPTVDVVVVEYLAYWQFW